MAEERLPRSRFSRRTYQVNNPTTAVVDFKTSKSCWCPRSSVVFNVLLSARISSAFLSNISDCDEIFNYWEPTHYLMYGHGFQTWEYSPKYAIRSYGYLLLHVIPAQIVKQFFQANKMTVFYYIRFLLGILCAACETYFFRALAFQFGNHVARLFFVFSVLCTGMFISAAAYLPSSFAMYACLISFGGWFNRNYPVAIFGIAVGSLVGWPFFALLGIPIAFDMGIRQRRFWTFLQWSFGIFLAIMIPLVAIDTHYYGKQVIAPLNIVLYNIFGQGGPDLYGVESWKFYFINGFLNFNIVFIMAFVSLPFCILTHFFLKYSQLDVLKLPTLLVLSPMYIWFLVFFTRPHKEERFLFPVYPLILLCACILLSKFQEVYHQLFTSKKRIHFSDSSNWLAVVLVIIFSVLSLSRSAALFTGYRAPLELYPELHNLVNPFDVSQQPTFREDQEIVVCVGREWYRYPSSFFLPDSWEYRFIKSDFKGQLPQPYSSKPDGTKVVPLHMNDLNEEEATSYTAIDKCDLLIDVDLSTSSEHELNYSNMTTRWEVIHTKRFLDASKSHKLFRAFYIPFLSEQHTTYMNYNLLKSKKMKKKYKKTKENFI